MSKNLEILNSAKSLQTLSGIDTLYYFIKVSYLNYTSFYNDFVLKDKLIDVDFEKVSDSNNVQFIWYRKYVKINDVNIPLFRIGFKNLNTRDGLFSLYIQLESATMHYFGVDKVVKMVEEHINCYGLIVEKEQVSRSDLNIFVNGYDFGKISHLDFKTSVKSARKIYGSVEHNEFIVAGDLQTLYLGKSKSSGVQLKIYNKFAELSSKNDYFKSSVLSALFYSTYGNSFGNDFWNIEFSLRRESLKSYSIDTVSDLLINANSLFIKLMERYVYLESSKNDLKNVYDIKPHFIWSTLKNSYRLNSEPVFDITKIKTKQYKHDIKWLYNRFNEHLEENPSHTIDDVFLELRELYSKQSII